MPRSVALILTVPVTVTPFNIHELRGLVANGEIDCDKLVVFNLIASCTLPLLHESAARAVGLARSHVHNPIRSKSD